MFFVQLCHLNCDPLQRSQCGIFHLQCHSNFWISRVFLMFRSGSLDHITNHVRTNGIECHTSLKHADEKPKQKIDELNTECWSTGQVAALICKLLNHEIMLEPLSKTVLYPRLIPSPSPRVAGCFLVLVFSPLEFLFHAKDTNKPLQNIYIL